MLFFVMVTLAEQKRIILRERQGPLLMQLALLASHPKNQP